MQIFYTPWPDGLDCKHFPDVDDPEVCSGYKAGHEPPTIGGDFYTCASRTLKFVADSSQFITDRIVIVWFNHSPGEQIIVIYVRTICAFLSVRNQTVFCSNLVEIFLLW